MQELSIATKSPKQKLQMYVRLLCSSLAEVCTPLQPDTTKRENPGARGGSPRTTDTLSPYTPMQELRMYAGCQARQRVSYRQDVY